MRVSFIIVTNDWWFGSCPISYTVALAMTPLLSKQILVALMIRVMGEPIVVLPAVVVIDGSLILISDLKQYVVSPFHEPSPTYVALPSNSSSM